MYVTSGAMKSFLLCSEWMEKNLYDLVASQEI